MMNDQDESDKKQLENVQQMIAELVIS